MSQSCGGLEYIPGGVINGSTIINSQISNGTISGSTIESSIINSLVSIDAASAQVIANAIAALPPSQLKPLLDALLAAFVPDTQTDPPSTETGRIPTTIYGDATGLLGKPAAFGGLGAYSVPLYSRS